MFRSKPILPPALPLVHLALGAALSAAPPTGEISRHLWFNVGGDAVSNLTSLPEFPDSPDTETTHGDFHAPADVADDYGTRMFGWVHAPVTGEYTFWIHSDDNSQLWLSTSESPDDRTQLASVPQWTGDGEWDKFPSQQSEPVTLEAGEYYFIEALHKEGIGGDNLGVAWSYPGQSRTYIPGSSLSSWQNVGPVANDDTATLAPGGGVNLPVLDNDLDPNGGIDLDPASLEILTGPAHGSASVDAALGRVIYNHDGGGTGTDSLTYRVRDRDGVAATATVDLTISDDMRLPNTTHRMPPEPPAAELRLEPAFGNLPYNQPLAIRSIPGDPRLWICEKGGDLELIPDAGAENPTLTTFLDLDSIINSRAGETFLTGSEQGLLSVAFHPDYASNGVFFLVYNVDNGGDNVQRLSRWTDPDPDDDTAASATEEIMIEMSNDAGNHNGGDMHFGPDGYLYMSWGDEGSQNDNLGNAQHIDEDFWSSLIRIDVDLETEDYTENDGTGGDDANLRPNDHPAVVLHDGDPLYEIPAGNPWIGARSFNGVRMNPDDIRTEFFAVGFRNPWRFSFDPMTGEIWLGDVGQGAREEIDVVEIGSNHGWSWREGLISGPRAGQSINGGSQSAADLTDPLWDYPHSEGRSVTGGLRYRGTGIPELTDKYLFADYVSGNIWSLDPNDGDPVVERLFGEVGIVGFGLDPVSGDVLLADLDGEIHRIARDTDEGDFPSTLAETGLFLDTATLEPNPGLVPYDVNLPFWSDFALKQRWFTIPDTEPTFGFAAEDSWSLPDGTLWVKHFDMLADDADPDSRFRIETRVLVKNSDGMYGVSYRWNETGTEATLAPDAGVNFPVEVVEDGAPTTRTWSIPSRAECLSCHNPAAGHALSFNTRQLNHEGEIAGVPGNFVDLLELAGYLDSPPGDPATLPRHVAPDEEDYSLEARARSYLDVNCAYCHRPGGGSNTGSWDGRHALTLEETNLINGMLGSPVDPADRLIVPGEPDRSAILSRTAATNGYTRMPPIASNVSDPGGVELLTRWINEEADAVVSYDDYRTQHFGDLVSAEGEPGADPDGDGVDNEREWLQNTVPTDPSSRWRLQVDMSGDDVSLSHPALGNRSVLIEHSTDLETWERWDVPGNDTIPRNPGDTPVLTAPRTEAEGFFRAEIEER